MVIFGLSKPGGWDRQTAPHYTEIFLPLIPASDYSSHRFYQDIVFLSPLEIKDKEQAADIHISKRYNDDSCLIFPYLVANANSGI